MGTDNKLRHVEQSLRLRKGIMSQMFMIKVTPCNATDLEIQSIAFLHTYMGQGPYLPMKDTSASDPAVAPYANSA